jgi:isocitrate/isopropylmalate dehydrogenase
LGAVTVSPTVANVPSGLSLALTYELKKYINRVKKPRRLRSAGYTVIVREPTKCIHFGQENSNEAKSERHKLQCENNLILDISY